MSKNILIDSAHSEETRVAVINNGELERFDFESTTKLQVRGNIYLAKVIRVEPSLQAAFVDYGMGRHGFLSFSEVHHDYFQIPVDDRQELDEHINNAIAARAEEFGVTVEELDQKEVGRIRYQLYRRYKIQEVIKKRQIMLVQVTKEERGNKGASLTTYISLAGRYCVLMPNTEKSSGVSRKITNHNDRVKLKKIVAGLKVEHGSVVLRTAAIGHTKTEIRKDFDYLCKMWDEIRQKTLNSTAPCLIHEEAGIIKRSIRDMYSKDIDAVIVEGKEGYKIAKQCMKNLMPSHAKKVQLYEDGSEPLFKKFNINDQIRQIYSTRVDLPSGGYLIINNTEALISVDVNSGKSTRERNIAGTALKTNLEAAVALARQCKLRDLAGLIVVDFIDMEDKRDNTKVEKCLKNALRDDKAKIQVGSITNFGLLEFSRQRLRSSIADANMIICPHCRGTGFIWSEESNAIQVLRRIEESCSMLNAAGVRVTLPPSVALYIINHKRLFLSNIEERNNIHITINIDPNITALDFKIDPINRLGTRAEMDADADEDVIEEKDSEHSKSAVKSKKSTTSDNKKQKTDEPATEQPRKSRRAQRKQNKRNQIAESETNVEEKVVQSIDDSVGIEPATENNHEPDIKRKAIKLRNYKKSSRRNDALPDAEVKADKETEEMAKPVSEEKSKEEESSSEQVTKKGSRSRKNSHGQRKNAETSEVNAETSEVKTDEKNKKAKESKVKTVHKPVPAELQNAAVENLANLSLPSDIASAAKGLQLRIDAVNQLTELGGVLGDADMFYSAVSEKRQKEKSKKRGWWQKLLKKPNNKGGE